MSPARVQRIHHIRSRVVAAAVGLFVAVFGVIGVRLASGHDPALSKPSATKTSTTSTTNSASSTQLTTSEQPSQAVSPVTTSQS